MKTIFDMKKIIAIAFVAMIGFSSCAKRYTCPTYLKNDEVQEDIRVKNQDLDQKQEEITTEDINS